MKYIKYILFFIPISFFCQQEISTKFLSKQSLNIDTLVNIDKFNTQYSFNSTTFYSKGDKGYFEYSNLQLGNISSVNTFNPLKINLFYKDFNSVIILDNRLSEIKKINFNALIPFRIVSNITSSNDNSIWIFNDNTRQLELFDFITNKSKYKTLPIDGEVYDLKSNYNTCWLLTKEHIYVFSYFGSMLKKIKNNGYKSIAESNGNLVLKKDNSLFYLKNDSENVVPISIPNLLINRFFVTNETLYIYDGEMLHQYQLLND